MKSASTTSRCKQDDGFTLPFLADKTRESISHRQFTAHWEDLSFPRRYWIEVLEKGSGAAEVEARMQAENRIEIRRSRRQASAHLVAPLNFCHRACPSRSLINKKKVFEGIFKPDCKTLAESSARHRRPSAGIRTSPRFQRRKVSSYCRSHSAALQLRCSRDAPFLSLPHPYFVRVLQCVCKIRRLSEMGTLYIVFSCLTPGSLGSVQ